MSSSFYDAQKSAPIAGEAIALILEMYRVGHQALEMRIVGKPEHLQLRKDSAAPARSETQRVARCATCVPSAEHSEALFSTPPSTSGELGRFLDDAKILSTATSLSARFDAVALGRKNFLFVGRPRSGKNRCGSLSLIATCRRATSTPSPTLPT
ncbi:MAG: transposase [Sandaracinaceae bacterium]|nr:transposase [Sandaracinaceae bacterium]